MRGILEQFGKYSEGKMWPYLYFSPKRLQYGEGWDVNLACFGSDLD